MANNPDEHVLDFQDFTSMNEPSGAIVNGTNVERFLYF
jgi:hypothetical protein